MIYIIKMIDTNFYKIGFTDSDSPDSRIASLQTGCPRKIELIGTVAGSERDEVWLQSQFTIYKSGGGQEWFNLPEEAVQNLMILLRKENLDEYQHDQCSIGGASAFDVRPLSGGQQHPTPERRKDVPHKRSSFDHTRDQPVFPALRRKREKCLPPIHGQKR
jgi:hypothetical protein